MSDSNEHKSKKPGGKSFTFGRKAVSPVKPDPANHEVSEATVSPVKPAIQQKDALERRLENAEAIMANGGLQIYSKEMAIEKGLPLMRFKVGELVVHPYNQRPVSANEDLSELEKSMAAHGQQDPIHVVPYQGGYAIMEGQRRWLSAKNLSLSELDGFLHPMPDDAFEIYAYGHSVHGSRVQPTAIDLAVVWGRMIEDGVADQGKIAARTEMDKSEVSRALAILKTGPRILDEIRKGSARFSARHLYAISLIHSRGGESKALEVCRSVIAATDDKPVTTRHLERIAESLQNPETPKPTRKRSTQLVIRGKEGEGVGFFQFWRTGKFTYEPEATYAESDAEALVEKIRAVIEEHARTAKLLKVTSTGD